MYRNSPPLCTIVLQIPSLMPLKMRKVQQKGGTGKTSSLCDIRKSGFVRVPEGVSSK